MSTKQIYFLLSLIFILSLQTNLQSHFIYGNNYLTVGDNTHHISRANSMLVGLPLDYDGFMGVPITFLHKHNKNQFEILGIMNTGEENKGIRLPNTPHGRPLVNGKEKYLRVIIRNKKL